VAIVTKAGGLTAATAKFLVKIGVNESYASTLVAIMIILITMSAWYGIYTFCSKIYKTASDFADRMKAAIAAIEQMMPPRRPNTRTIGVQSQVHYTWHDTEPRFKARENGFTRSGEVTIEPS